MKLFSTLLAIFPMTALAGASNMEGLKQSSTPINVTVTHYSATPKGGKPCPLECGYKNGKRRCWGGKDESASGYRPLANVIDNGGGTIKGRSGVVLAAVPQVGGNANIFGCFFTLPDAYPNQLFFAGDRYGDFHDSGFMTSNYQFKTDISSLCTNKIKKMTKSKLIPYNCPGKRGGSGKDKIETQAEAKKSPEAAVAQGEADAKQKLEEELIAQAAPQTAQVVKQARKPASAKRKNVGRKIYRKAPTQRRADPTPGELITNALKNTP